MTKLGSTDLKRLHRSWRRRTEGSLGLLLDHVQGPYNVGAIVRTAAAYRVDHLWTIGGTRPDAEKVGKTSMGTERFVPWTHTTDVAAAVKAVGAAGLRLVGVELTDDAVPIHEADLSDPVCLAVGNEAHGLADGMLEACDQVVYLPQLGRVGSLNVATAAALAIWEVRRRGW